MTDTVKHMWDQVEKARADGTFSSEQAAVPAQDAALQEALQDCKTNRDAWREAITFQAKLDVELAHTTYWDHELRAFDRTFAALTAPHTPAGDDDLSCAQLQHLNGAYEQTIEQLREELSQARAQVENANKRWEAVHDMVHRAREMVRLQIDAKDRPEGLFQTLQDALYAIRSRETSNA